MAYRNQAQSSQYNRAYDQAYAEYTVRYRRSALIILQHVKSQLVDFGALTSTKTSPSADGGTDGALVAIADLIEQREA